MIMGLVRRMVAFKMFLELELSSNARIIEASISKKSSWQQPALFQFM